jgi:predicted amidohydrolase
MAQEWKHRRYFKQYNNSTSSYVTFTSVEDAQAKIGLGSCFDTRSPAKSYELQDAGQTLVVTFAFDSKEDFNAQNSAVDAAYADTSSMFTGNTWNVEGETVTPDLQAQIVKFEYLTPPAGTTVQTEHTFTY